MSVLVKLLLVLAVSYLLGSVSFAIIVGKVFYKKDIRDFGSGNAGMTNVLRTFGKKAAVMTIVGDVLKGTVSVLFARWIFGNFTPGFFPQAINELQIMGLSIQYDQKALLEVAIYLAVTGSFLGHLYPLFFKFKGGKGVSVIAGSMIAATPVTLLCALGVFLIVVFFSKIVSLSSMIASVSYFVFTLLYFYFTQSFSLLNLVVSIIFPSFIVYSHRTNIKRLLNGTEYKFGQKKE